MKSIFYLLLGTSNIACSKSAILLISIIHMCFLYQVSNLLHVNRRGLLYLMTFLCGIAFLVVRFYRNVQIKDHPSPAPLVSTADDRVYIYCLACLHKPYEP